MLQQYLELFTRCSYSMDYSILVMLAQLFVTLLVILQPQRPLEANAVT